MLHWNRSTGSPTPAVSMCGNGRHRVASVSSFSHLRIAGTALAVAHERGIGTGLGARVYLRLELREQAVFQPQVFLEGANLVGPGRPKLLRQLRGVPGIEQLAAATVQQRDRAGQHDECTPAAIKRQTPAARCDATHAHSSGRELPGTGSSLLRRIKGPRLVQRLLQMLPHQSRQDSKVEIESSLEASGENDHVAAPPDGDWNDGIAKYLAAGFHLRRAVGSTGHQRPLRGRSNASSSTGVHGVPVWSSM